MYSTSFFSEINDNSGKYKFGQREKPLLFSQDGKYMISPNQIYKIYGTDYTKMTKTLLAVSGLSEMIPGPDTRIGIKPNLVCPTPAEYGATTHPEIVAGIIEYLQENGFRKIIIVEGSWVGDKTPEAFDYCGYNSLSQKYGVPLIDTQKESSHSVAAAGLPLRVTDVVDQIDFLINVPVLKGHCQTKMTCALKNLKGLLPNAEKRRFHSMGLHKPIAHLSAAVHQDFIVIDHICGDLDFEEGGNPVVRNCIMTALDPVLTDAYACRLMGYTPGDVPYVRMAEQLGCGTADINHARIIRLEREAAAGERSVSKSGKKQKKEPISHHPENPLQKETGQRPNGHREMPVSQNAGKTQAQSTQPSTGKIKQVIETPDEERLPTGKKLLQVSYAVDEVDSCSACYGNLIPALYRLKEEGLLDKLNTPIAIGQGHQGKHGSLGIGKCTKEFDICIMGCPPDEETIYEKLRELCTAGDHEGTVNQ